MFMNKAGNFWTEQKHNDHGDHNRSDHNFNSFCGASGRQNTVKRKNCINKYDLYNGLAEWQAFSFFSSNGSIFAFESLMYFPNRFINKKKTSTQHDNAGQVKPFSKPVFGNDVFSFLSQSPTKPHQ